ncbi:cobalt-zinc-cadmium resistance protein [Ramlibacter pinisoli]|uniref:Cobalt-zinc-cadmium resistance protein n=1 Tax=Ramlibacter pinisoli TaxID=2682844 RepID=A0A6N8IS18_9BURK|nr:cobalt-zinc-cadmium resistance protein [Ramlibacter pinisoli]MVQ29637.1 cobalt-zinc-cadmium resistance protein [Ramlibacter pinisoli]
MPRRLLLLLIAVLLPLQLAWGASASYCQHETGAASKHFGHHEHVHKAGGKKAVDLKVAPDNDCGTCHGAGATAVTALRPIPLVPRLGEAPVAPSAQAPPSLPPDSPDRPQWPRLA